MCWYNPHIHEKNHLLGTSNLFQRGEKGRRHTRRGRVVNRQECCLLLGLVLRHAHTKPVGSIAKRVLTTFDWLGGEVEQQVNIKFSDLKSLMELNVRIKDASLCLFIWTLSIRKKVCAVLCNNKRGRTDDGRHDDPIKSSPRAALYIFFFFSSISSLFFLLYLFIFSFGGCWRINTQARFSGPFLLLREREKEKKREKERERMITCEPIATSGCVHNPGREWEKITGPFVHRPTAERTARDASTRTRGKGRKRKESSPRVVISFSSATGAISPPYTVGRPAEEEEASLREGSRKTCVCDTQLFTHVRINKAKQGPPTTINAREK